MSNEDEKISELAMQLADMAVEQTKKGFNPDEYDDKTALFLIRENLKEMRQILKLINSYNFYLPDDLVNSYYTELNLKIDLLLEKKSLKHLRKEKSDLIWDTIAGSDFDIYAGMTPDIILEVEKFYGCVEKEILKLGAIEGIESVIFVRDNIFKSPDIR